MAFHDLVIIEEKTPGEAKKIMQSLGGLQKDMISTANYSKTEDRIKNIDKTKGLIQRYFVKKDPPMLRHGAGLALDFENAMRRSKIETGRYECKQGLVNLADVRSAEKAFEIKIVETICAIANVGPDSDGFLFLGVADKESDAKRIKALDGIDAIKIGNRFVVGIDRELLVLSISIETYVKRLSSIIASSQLSDTLKHHVSSQIDIITYKGLSIIRLRVPPQKDVSFVGEKAYIRDDSSSVEAKGKKLLAISTFFL